MAVFRKRNRVLSFRLSDEEYEMLRQVSLAEGARSVSDYARAALSRLTAGRSGSDGGEIVAKVLQLDEQVQALRDELRRLEAAMAQGLTSQGAN